MAFDRRETAILLIGDFLILAASLWVALLLRNLAIPTWGYFEANLIPFVPMFLISLVVFYISGLYEKQTKPIRRKMGVRILGAQGATTAIAAILFFVLPLSIAPKIILLLYLLVSIIAESIWRFARMKKEIKDSDRTPALLIGTGSAQQELFDEVNGNPRYLIRFVDRIDTALLPAGGVYTAIENSKAGEKVVVIDSTDAAVIREMPVLYGFLAGAVTLTDFSTLYEEIFDRVPLDHVDSVQLMQSLPKSHEFYDLAKRLFDIVLAIFLSVIAIPFITIAVALLLPQGGQPFIFNERIGKGGRTFRIIKLRSMLFNDQGQPELQQKNRVTGVGKVLRKTRIDELPQLWNVFVGDLSFIGPRPELPKIAETYEREIPQYRLRHVVSPGLSGWAQIHDTDAPKGPADVKRTRRKVSFDLYYLKNRSFGLDLAIALKTLRTLLSLSGV